MIQSINLCQDSAWILDSPDLKLAVQAIENCRLKGRSKTKYRFITKRGQCKWVLVRMRLERDEEHNRDLICGNFIDLSVDTQDFEGVSDETFVALGQMAGPIAHQINNDHPFVKGLT